MSEARIQPIDLSAPDPRLLEHTARLLHEGEIVAAPSDTVYGLLALPRSRRARMALRVLKGRERPFIVLVSSWEEARSWTRGVRDPVWHRLTRVWPGPVTVILPTRSDMPGSECGGIAIRMPDSVFLNGLLTAVGEPLFSTSANRAGEPTPGTAEEVARSFETGLAIILDGGPAAAGRASTLVDLLPPEPVVVREGSGDPGPLLDPGRGPS